MKAAQVVEDLKRRFPNEPEYIQAVEEVLSTIEEEYNKHPEFEKVNLIERLCIPDRVISFRVSWMDDQGNIRTNMGYRVQHNNAIGPYKGGIRFHSSVNLGILKFLAFEQTFKNSLTTLPMGGAKGGSDFSPRGKSDAEVMRFCQAFMTELERHIGPDVDVPAGDIGVGGREVGFMFGQYKKLRHEFSGVLTGKGMSFGGSKIRPEATGYGNVYFLMEMLKNKYGIEDLKGKSVLISGSGNVAQYTAEKVLQLGGKVLTMSDSDGYIYDPNGIDRKKLDYIMELKNLYRGRIKEYAEEFEGVKYVAGAKPWNEKADIALPSATQNELNGEAAKALVANGVIAVSEGANMPSTPEAIEVFQNAKILYAPGKAANAGGVSVSGLEMSQNSERLSWTEEQVDEMLHNIMKNIHENCLKYGTEPDGYINYVKGANVAGFIKVANAMMAQGVV
jgi:glutamate dehydrogenase (NADP+)